LFSSDSSRDYSREFHMIFTEGSEVIGSLISFFATHPYPAPKPGIIAALANVFTNLGPVQTNPFSNENGAVLLRIRLSSTQQRRKTITENGVIRKRSPKWSDLKTMLFENAVF